MECVEIYKRNCESNLSEFVVIYLSNPLKNCNDDDSISDTVVATEQQELLQLHQQQKPTTTPQFHHLFFPASDEFIVFQQTPQQTTITTTTFEKNERKKSSLPTIPTISYTVGNRDTLTSVAARFDTTPSELTHLNRLNSSFIYPGQQLLVPDKSAKDDASTTSSTGTTDEKGASASGKSSPVERKLSTDEQNDEKVNIITVALRETEH
ncbi:nuclear receptor coactivator 7-like [Teleopsis dalmanni]|uniref:nuclear receptor coactivator 7-like n=1 Tax=Teleopsis dalmanni TaxID=139649 RepID=UPI0018CE3E61|nr:nuclear receptor coactivator 7-like [Teleopsis dalmanni]XP_037944258.1 nuclear receptor coactivator 7-like [Teleopsis dalmanni]XP_037944365.1 nuclear receptor coactivator 7-like [Teleopsis dalmanni]